MAYRATIPRLSLLNSMSHLIPDLPTPSRSSSAGIASRLPSLPTGAAVGLDGARASLGELPGAPRLARCRARGFLALGFASLGLLTGGGLLGRRLSLGCLLASRDRKSTRLNSSHVAISYAVF